MENITTNKLILLIIVFIFSLTTAKSVLAFNGIPDCIVSNFKANGSTSITISSGSPVTLTWNTMNCKSIELSGKGINTNVAQNGYMTINPTVSSYYSISATVYGYPTENLTVEVNVIPKTTSVVNTQVIENMNPVVSTTQYNYYPSQNTSNTSTTIKSTSTSIAKKATSSTSKNTAQTSNTDTGNDLTALSFRGSGGFMPSSIWQWLLVIILILVIIILSRTLVKKPSPSDHDTHAVHAH